MLYEWDENKRMANLERHNSDFKEAVDFEWDIMKKNNKNISDEIWQDIESPPLSDDMLARMKLVKEQHPDIPKRVRGRQKDPLKIPVSIRLSPDVVSYFKSQGKGWQSKIDSILHNHIKSH